MNAEEKYKTCIFKSPEEVSKIIQRCSCQGGNYEIKGFFCNKKQLMNVAPSDCQDCDEYQSK
jgi:hypothetical protein